MSEPDVEFVNDWSELGKAMDILKDVSQFGDEHGEFDCSGLHHSEDVSWAICTVRVYVPALIDSWSQLYELSLTITEAWEAYSKGLTPAGLVVPATSTSGALKMPVDVPSVSWNHE